MENLTKEVFKTDIFNYEQKKEWVFAGKLPCIIDFYADWCGPCKMVFPILEKIAEEYSGKLNVYKVDTETQTELASLFGISSIPSILFVPKTGKPQMVTGALPRESFITAIKDVMKVERP